MRRLISVFCLCCSTQILVTALIGICSGEHLDAAPISSRPDLITPRAVQAVKGGLKYLDRTQNRNGSWHARGASASRGYTIAMTSLAGTAFLSAGNTPLEGPYAQNLRRAIDYILRHAGKSGLIADPNNTNRPMHGHGFAMLFLAETYGMGSDPNLQERIRRVLRKAIDLTVRSQSDAGGWYYTPDSRNDEGSVTVTQIQGLRACRNAGIKVPKKTIDRACEYIRKCSNEEGGIAYRLGMTNTRPAITAAAVATMYNAGRFENPVAEDALRYTLNHMQNHKNKPFSAYRGHSFYGMLYASQAIWFAGKKEWKQLFPAIRRNTLQLQQDDGSWSGDHVGRVYGTAIALMILNLPNRYLPILQR